MNGIIETMEEFECVLESYQFKGMSSSFFASQAWGLVQRLRRNGISARALSGLLEKYGLKGRIRLNDWIAGGRKRGPDDEYAFEKYLENARLKVGATLTYDFRKKDEEPNEAAPRGEARRPREMKPDQVHERPDLRLEPERGQAEPEFPDAKIEQAADDGSSIVPGLGRPLKKARKASEINNQTTSGEMNHGKADGSHAYERGSGNQGGGAYEASLRAGIPDFARSRGKGD